VNIFWFALTVINAFVLGSYFGDGLPADAFPVAISAVAVLVAGCLTVNRSGG
jgi:hypothetical protein